MNSRMVTVDKLSRWAAIDLGTNTCLLTIVEGDFQSGKYHSVLRDESTIVRLGQGIQRTGRLDPEAMDRTLTCLERYCALLREAGLDGPQRVYAVATAQARLASNSREFFDRVEVKTGIKFETISGAREAELSFLGAVFSDTPLERQWVLDIGGGSTELKGPVAPGVSVPLGSVVLTDKYALGAERSTEVLFEVERQLNEAFRGAFLPFLPMPAEFVLVGVAGTCTTLAAMHRKLERFDAETIESTVLTLPDVDYAVGELRARTVDGILGLCGVDPGRAPVIFAGALILQSAMRVLHAKALRVSTRGLRYGVLAQGSQVFAK